MSEDGVTGVLAKRGQYRRWRKAGNGANKGNKRAKCAHECKTRSHARPHKAYVMGPVAEQMANQTVTTPMGFPIKSVKYLVAHIWMPARVNEGK